jgi:hypothetical protein
MNTETKSAGDGPVERGVRLMEPERGGPGPCGDPNCEDGHVWTPPGQEGAMGCLTDCPRCAENWRRYWACR